MFFRCLYGVRYTGKVHPHNEIENLPLHGLLILISNKVAVLGMHHPTNRIAHTIAFVTPVVEHWSE